MADTVLKIHADVQGALDGVNKVTASVDNLNKTTENYTKKSTEGFNQTATAASVTTEEITRQQQKVKDLELTVERFAKREKELTDRQKRSYQDRQNDLTKARGKLDDLTRSQRNFGKAQDKTTEGAKTGMDAFKKLSGVISVAFAVATIIKFTKAVIESSNATKKSFDEIKQGLGDGIQFLLRTITGADFGSLIQGFRDAYEEGIRYAEMLSELELRQRALGIWKGDIEIQQLQLRQLMRLNTTSLDDKKKYIDEYLKLEELKLKQSTRLATDAVASELKHQAEIVFNTKETTDAQRQAIMDYVSTFDINLEFYKKRLQEANDLYDRLEGLKPKISKIGIPSGDIDAYKLAISSLTVEEQKLLDLRTISNTLLPKQLDLLGKLITGTQNVTKESITSEDSLMRTRNELETKYLQSIKKVDDATQKANEDRLKTLIEQQELLWELFGAPPTFEEWEQQFIDAEELMKDNLEGFQKWADDNPMQWGENSWDAKEFDRAFKEAQDKILELQKFAEDHPFWEALGFTNDEQIDAVKDFAKELSSIISDIVDQQVQASERLVDDLNNRIDEQEQLVNREYDDKKEGLANNYDLEQENLVKMQKARDAAIKDREKQIKIQKTLTTIESSVALIGAAAQIFKSLAPLPFGAGVALGVIAVGTMIAGFIAAQAKVKDATQFAEGGLLTGKKHSQGGIRIPGTNIEVEGDEFVTNRRSTSKYLPLLEAINKDDQTGMKLFFDRKFLNKMPKQSFNFDIDKSKKLGEIVKNTRKNNSDVFYGNGYIIERAGGYTKKINLN